MLINGGVAERLKAAVSKIVVQFISVPRVRIPAPPPEKIQLQSIYMKSQAKEKKRICYIDIAKCIAVFFVIVCHTGLIFPDTMQGGMPTKIVHFAFTFHLPVFFLASGYFFKLDQPLNLQFFKKSFRNLIVPYIVCCIIITIFALIVACFNGASKMEILIFWIKASLYGCGSENPLQIIPTGQIGGIWFFLGLFWAQILILLVRRLPLPGIWLFAIFMVDWYIAQRYLILPFSLSTAPCAALFVYAGTLAKKYQVFDLKNIGVTIATVICLVIWLVYIFATDYHMGMSLPILPHGLLDIIGSFAGGFIVVKLCKLCEAHLGQLSKFLQWIGRNTLVVFAVHIIQDNVIGDYWDILSAKLSIYFPDLAWIPFLIIRCLLIALACGIIYLIPLLNSVFFVTKRRKTRQV